MNVDPPPLPSVNPYAAPSANLEGVESFSGPELVSDRSVQLLRRTRPWVLLMTGIGMIVTAVLLVFALELALSGAGTHSTALGMRLGAGYGIAGVILLVISISMLRYSSAIGRLVRRRSIDDLNAALEAQRRVWLCFGILALLYIALVAVAVAGGQSFVSLRR